MTKTRILQLKNNIINSLNDFHMVFKNKIEMKHFDINDVIFLLTNI